MNKLVILSTAIMLLLPFYCFSSVPPVMRYKVVVSPSILKKMDQLAPLVKVWFSKYGYTLVADPTLKKSGSEYIVHTRDFGAIPVDFVIEDMYSSKRSSEPAFIVMTVYERGKTTPHTIRVADNESELLERRLMNLFTFRESDPSNIGTIDYLNPSFSKLDTLYLKGLLFQNMRRYDTALAYHLKALELNKDDDAIIYAAAICYKNLGKTDQYKQFLDKAIQLNPSNEAYTIELGNYLLHRNLTDRAIASYLQVANSAKCGDIANWNLFVAYKKAGQKKEAYQHLKNIPTFSKYYVSAQALITKRERQLEKVTAYVKSGFFILSVAALVYLLVTIFRRKEKAPPMKWETASAMVGFIISLSGALVPQVTEFIVRHFFGGN